MDYTCYVHMAGRVAPEVRFFSASEAEVIKEHLQQMAHEWPSYERIEIFDEDDQPVSHDFFGDSGEPQT